MKQLEDCDFVVEASEEIPRGLVGGERFLCFNPPSEFIFPSLYEVCKIENRFLVEEAEIGDLVYIKNSDETYQFNKFGHWDLFCVGRFELKNNNSARGIKKCPRCNSETSKIYSEYTNNQIDKCPNCGWC